MKQHITKKQWEELPTINEIGDWMVKSGYWLQYGKGIDMETGGPSIGQMIEFLGDDLIKISIEKDEIVIKDDKKPNGVWVLRGGGVCNNLWEAVKYKLK